MTDLTGQIGLIPHPKTLLELLIDLITVSPVHHSVLAISATECISCEASGARIRPISHYPDAYWSHYPHTPEVRDKIVGWGVERIGRPYGWFTDFAIGIALIFHKRTPEWVRRYLSNDGWWECAEFCDAAYVQAGQHLFEGVISAEVYPGMFVPLWEKEGWMP